MAVTAELTRNTTSIAITARQMCPRQRHLSASANRGSTPTRSLTMVPAACSNTHSRICLRFSLCLLFGLTFAVTAYAQTATFHLHRDSNIFQLKTASPDTAAVAVQSANLKNQALGEYLIKAFDTQSG